MKQLKFIVLVLCSVYFLNACDNPVKKELQPRIDSLLQVVLSIDSNCLLLNTDSIPIIYLEVKNNIKAIKRDFNQIQLDDNFKKIYSEYSLIEEQLKNLNKGEVFIKKEINYSVSQLQNLSKDIDSEILKKADALKYYESENKAVSLLTKKTEPFLEKYKRVKKHFYRIKPGIDQIIKDLKNSI